MQSVNNQKGYVISIVTFFVLIIMLSMALGMSSLVVIRQKNIANSVKSTQAYYAAEAGLEDALLRLKKTPQMSSLSYGLNVNNVAVGIDIPTAIGITRSITSQANNGGVTRKIRIDCNLDNSQNVDFYYGIEVGPGGLVMNNGSEVVGNVFSGGNISGSGIISNNAVISGNGHSISGVTVNGDVLAYSCLSPANVIGNLTYVTGGAHTCTVGGATSVQSEEIFQQPLPIPQSQIDSWKDGTVSNIISGDVIIGNNQTLSMGPAKISGSLIFRNKASLIVTGTIYVQGDIVFGNNDSVTLDGSYNNSGGVILADGTIDTGNGNVFSGSGQNGSYIMFISTNTSDSAIIVSNNSNGAVFYTTAGGLLISNNVSVVEATGYKIIMSSNSTIQYSSGIVNIFFSSGPGGGWKITDWQEY